MPFTIAHPALVLPLKRLWPRYFSLSGLMAGAMSPDLLYFLNLTTLNRGLSHSWIGLALFCVPAAVVFCFAFHRLFKYHFLINLPSPLDRFFSGLAMSKWGPVSARDWLVVVGSVLVGALSHFFWDSFTHASGVLARAIPLLSSTIEISGNEVGVTVIAQHCSTVGGMIAIIYFLARGWLTPPPVSSFQAVKSGRKLLFWLGTISSAFLFAGMVVLAFERFWPNHPVGSRIIWGLSGWSGFFYSTAAYTVIRNMYGATVPQAESHTSES